MPNYPNPTAVRLAYDRDGTLVYKNIGGVLTQQTQANLNNGNDESDIYWGGTTFLTDNPIVNGGSGILIFIFPQVTDVTGMRHFLGTGTGFTGTIETSVNSTNGIDGTWVAGGSIPGSGGSVRPAYRTGITTLTISAVKMLRISSGNLGGGGYWNPMALHLYGKPAVSTTRLELWHPTLDQSYYANPAMLDREDALRSSSVVKSFRVKNLSTTLTASTITVSSNSLTASSPTLESQTTFRYNAGTYAATATISSLAPGAISQVVDAKTDVAAGAALSVWVQRFIASAATWT